VDAALAKVRQEPSGRGEAAVVMQDHDVVPGRGRADQRIDGGQGAVRAMANEAMLRGFDPAPAGATEADESRRQRITPRVPWREGPRIAADDLRSSR
jgi:hypothetical protein